jgi:anaerobic ribonucleoside-triphosphate reductase
LEKIKEEHPENIMVVGGHLDLIWLIEAAHEKKRTKDIQHTVYAS